LLFLVVLETPSVISILAFIVHTIILEQNQMLKAKDHYKTTGDSANGTVVKDKRMNEQ